MVYAQALDLFKKGFRFYFNKEEIQTITEYNEQFNSNTAEEELLVTYFEKIPVSQAITQVGDTYQSNLYIGNGFGEWTGGKIRCTYEILRRDQDSADTVWTISAKSEFDGKTNILKMIFSKKRGFILMDYSFFNGDKESVKLKE
jgi:predicted P-loop ATPase